MTSTYTHLPLNEPVEFISASYWISDEDKIPYKGREILCIVRETSPINCCDGCCSQGLKSVLIPGLIVRYKYQKREDGLFVSEVDPIEDYTAKEEIKKIVKENYNLSQIEFFCP